MSVYHLMESIRENPKTGSSGSAWGKESQVISILYTMSTLFMFLYIIDYKVCMKVEFSELIKASSLLLHLISNYDHGPHSHTLVCTLNPSQQSLLNNTISLPLVVIHHTSQYENRIIFRVLGPQGCEITSPLKFVQANITSLF